MVGKEKYELVENNQNIKQEDKEKIFRLFDVANRIEFGKIGPRQEGYLLEGQGYPRCTSVMSMDGTKAGALLEWAKREIAQKMHDLLIEKLHSGQKISDADAAMLVEKALKEPERQKDEAADTGTKAHDNIECWLNGEKYEESERLVRFKEIWAKEKVELVCTELPLVFAHNGLGFGGRLDILAYSDGDFFIYDNKTSKSVHQGYALQVSAYKNAVEQMSKGEIQIKGAKIIHLPDMLVLNKYQLNAYNKLGALVECKDLDKAFEHYKVLLQQYYLRNNKYY